VLVDQKREKAFTDSMVEAAERAHHRLATSEQEIAGGSHDFVTECRLRSETNNKQSNHGWTQPTRQPGTATSITKRSL